MKHFDAIISGTGQAGPPLAARFSGAGETVAIIERHKFGGTCVNTGCIPTKTMVASAYAAHVARRGGGYGFAVNGDVRVDMKRVKARKDAVSGRSNKGLEEWLRGTKNCTVIQGHARFQSSNTVAVNDEVLQADKVYINVGGRASVPEMPGIHDVPFFNNSSMTVHRPAARPLRNDRLRNKEDGTACTHYEICDEPLSRAMKKVRRKAL
jgi:pyruvate/2-oxoglutarate dehydrogenase complex dihydrolipoamide dehydrogenase (E3) component